MKLYDFTALLVTHTDKAWCLKEDEDSEAFWVPKSVTQLDETKKSSHGMIVVEVTIPYSVAYEKGLV